VITFQLEDEPSLATLPSTYIAVGVQYTDTQIFVGQNFYTLDTSATNPFATQPALSEFYGFQNNSTTSVSGRNFAISTYVVKIPPKSSFAYGFNSCKYKIFESKYNFRNKKFQINNI
jgi:hypothetical protein